MARAFIVYRLLSIVTSRNEYVIRCTQVDGTREPSSDRKPIATIAQIASTNSAIWTPFIPTTSSEKAEQHGEKVPFKRPGQPEEVAPSFVFFASEADSSYITGEVLSLLGGDTTAG